MKSLFLLLAPLVFLAACAGPAPIIEAPVRPKAPSEAQLEAARHAKAISQLKFWMRAFEAYIGSRNYGYNPQDPKTMEEIRRQVATVKNDIDPWGGNWVVRDVNYERSSGPNYTSWDHDRAICSAGPDGIFDTEDDVRGIRSRNKWHEASSALLDD